MTNKEAGQDAYHEARAFGHSKSEAQSIRNNWKYSKNDTRSNSNH
jgi:hypothetical protein